MKRILNLRRIVMAFGIMFIGLAGHPTVPRLGGLRVTAQEAKLPVHSKTAKAPSGTSSIWKSQTTGKEYRVRVENERFSAEWVNIPHDLVLHGAYIRTECRHSGSKWIGTSRSYLPCALGQGAKERIANWCRLLTRFEVESISRDSIKGRGESLKRFDCEHCKVLETVWGNFTWVPKQ